MSSRKLTFRSSEDAVGSVTPASGDGESLSHYTGHTKRACAFICFFQGFCIIVKLYSCSRKIQQQSLQFKFASQEIPQRAWWSLVTINDCHTSMDESFLLPTLLQYPLLWLLHYFAWQASMNELRKIPSLSHKSHFAVAARHKRHAYCLQVVDSSGHFVKMEHSGRYESILQVWELFLEISRQYKCAPNGKNSLMGESSTTQFYIQRWK